VGLAGLASPQGKQCRGGPRTLGGNPNQGSLAGIASRGPLVDVGSRQRGQSIIAEVEMVELGQSAQLLPEGRSVDFLTQRETGVGQSANCFGQAVSRFSEI